MISVFVFLDAAYRFQFSFQDSATPIHEGLLNLYEDLMSLLMGILLMVLVLLGYILCWFVDTKAPNNKKVRYLVINSNTLLEFIWTLLPGLFLIGLVMPTFSLLYAFDDALATEFSLKVIGHQWYWSYEFGDFSETSKRITAKNMWDTRGLSFDSYMRGESSLVKGQLRLLEVDNRLLLPKKASIRALITATDVLHSWAIPSFGVKIGCLSWSFKSSIYVY